MSRAWPVALRRSWLSAFVIVVLVIPQASLVAQPAARLVRDTACLQLNELVREGPDTARTPPGLERKIWVELRNARDECVRTIDGGNYRAHIVLAAATAESLGRLPWDIPEYHDEQRLPAGLAAPNQRVLGPMAKIFVSPFIGQFRQRWQIEEQGSPGILVAVITVKLEEGESVPPSYQRLHLQGGTNCLWLEAPTAGGWTARVSHVDDDASCDREGVPTGNVLEVKQQRALGFALADFPAVARFDVDASEAQPLFGVRCLNAWCEIGPSGFSDRMPWTAPAAASRIVPMGRNDLPGAQLTREQGIKGWHDEQRLAVNNAGIWTSSIRATVIPVPGVNDKPESVFNTWVRVAEIRIHDDPAGTKYAQWGLQQGINYLALRNFGGTWRAQITYAASPGARIWNNVTRHQRFNVALPGTVRFRWTIKDDTIWAPCGTYCCQVDGGDS